MRARGFAIAVCAALALGGSWGAYAQIPFASGSTGVAATVNGTVISNYDVDQRMALFVATSGARLTQENVSQIRLQVLRQLQDETIQTQEAAKRRITASQAEVQKAVLNIAMDNKLSSDQLMGTLAQSGVSAATFVRQVSAQIIWQKLVSARYGADILVSDQMLDEAMTRLRQGADKPQFLLSEIFIAVDKPEDDTAIRASAEQIAQQIKQGAPFQTFAGQFSQSPSAADGGDIGWVVQGQLAEEIDRALNDLRPIQVVGPVRAEGGYYVLQLRGRREPAGSSMMAAENPFAVDPAAPLPLDRFLIPLPANPDATLKERAIALATNVRSQARSCADLPSLAGQLQGTVHQRLGVMNPKDLTAELREALAKTAPGESLAPFFSAVGVELIMRCDSARVAIGMVELPTRDELRQQLFTQQMSLYAKSYLRDLRRDAIVYSTGR